LVTSSPHAWIAKKTNPTDTRKIVIMFFAFIVYVPADCCPLLLYLPAGGNPFADRLHPVHHLLYGSISRINSFQCLRLHIPFQIQTSRLPAVTGSVENGFPHDQKANKKAQDITIRNWTLSGCSYMDRQTGTAWSSYAKENKKRDLRHLFRQLRDRGDYGKMNGGGGIPLQGKSWRESNANRVTDDGHRDPIPGFPVFKALLCDVIKDDQSQ